MSCSNCFNGCAEIVSDQCVRYTGIDVPVLGIKTGDSLSYVEQALITFLTSTLDGSGIVINIPQDSYCQLVTKYLPTCGDITATVLFEALVKAACDLQEQVDGIYATLATLNSNYTVDCLSGVTGNEGTHDIVQAIITKLCQVDADLISLTVDVETNYVPRSELDTLIAAYLAGIAPVAQQNTKMIPYTVLPYFGSLGFFDGSGAGFPTLGWDKIYLCNGQNGTPDLRGRVLVGSIDDVPGGGALSPAVNPASDPINNPNYVLNDVYGSNGITLAPSELPSHTHTIVDNGHTHDIIITTSGSDAPNGAPIYPVTNSTAGEGGSIATNPPGIPGTQLKTTGITINNTGGGMPHHNTQPVWASYFIMYIP